MMMMMMMMMMALSKIGNLMKCAHNCPIPVDETVPESEFTRIPIQPIRQVYAMDLAERPFEYSTRLPANLVEETAPPGIPVLFKTLSTTMAELNHTRIDLLRLGGHRSVHEDLIAHWMAEGQTPPVCQVSISFHKADKHLGSVEGRELLLQLRDLGLELAICIPQGAVPEERVFESCLFFSVIHCVVRARS